MIHVTNIVTIIIQIPSPFEVRESGQDDTARNTHQSEENICTLVCTVHSSRQVVSTVASLSFHPHDFPNHELLSLVCISCDKDVGIRNSPAFKINLGQNTVNLVETFFYLFTNFLIF